MRKTGWGYGEDVHSISSELQTFRSDNNGLFTNTVHFSEEGIELDLLQGHFVDIHNTTVAGDSCPVAEDLGLNETPTDDGGDGGDVDEGDADTEGSDD